MSSAPWFLPTPPFPATLADCRRFGRSVSRWWFKPQFIGPTISEWQAYALKHGCEEKVVRVLSCRGVHLNTPIAHFPGRWASPVGLHFDLSLHRPHLDTYAERLNLWAWNFSDRLTVSDPGETLWQSYSVFDRTNVRNPAAPLAAFGTGAGVSQFTAVNALYAWANVTTWSNTLQAIPESPYYVEPDQVFQALPAGMFLDYTGDDIDGNPTFGGSWTDLEKQVFGYWKGACFNLHIDSNPRPFSL